MQARGHVVVFEHSMGNACLVSHQWVARQYPDPDFKQMSVLKDALLRLLSSQGTLPPHPVTGVLFV